MSSTSIIDGLYTYLDGCPLLSGRKFHIGDAAQEGGQTGVAYGIYADQADEQAAVYQGGTKRIRSQYLLSSTDDCTPDMAQQLSDAGLFDRLADWLSREDAKRVWPELPEGLTPRGIRAASAIYLYQPDSNAGKYQIQIELEYYRKVVD